MEELLQTILNDYGFLLYPLILVWTFVEGETVVILSGALASEHKYNINVELLALFAFAGSFAGDQLYYYIGRRYGTPLLNRWPTLGAKIDWAFQLVKTHPTLFILSFRFIYGVRNIAPFVIGISGVARLRYMALNAIAAMIWAHSFAWGGYFLGRVLEDWLGDNKWYMLVGFVIIALTVGLYGYFRNKRRMKAIEAKEQAEDTAPARSDQ
ncbi:DedA family protein [Magnetospirillum sulfuroxidans]|uniref:DedA family protein n=1 Tax=Magnetospirillum sulfuroxidans TaxID=611300 RepID=A0ABS5ICK9_9PROT|nr:DedA family protein [Magnetospirillum sulfuroxidans]MBR9972064.1 DedA family protein [Magnetospirillum sulfuroxidans]